MPELNNQNIQLIEAQAAHLVDLQNEYNLKCAEITKKMEVKFSSGHISVNEKKLILMEQKALLENTLSWLKESIEVSQRELRQKLEDYNQISDNDLDQDLEEKLFQV